MNSQRNKRLNKYSYFDFQIVFIVAVLVMFGLLMVYSSSSYRAVVSGFESTYFFKKQLGFAAIGFIGMIVVAFIDFRIFRLFAKVLMIAAIALLLCVMIFGVASHGRTRWIQIGPVQLQPSEIAKPILIIYLADICTDRSKNLAIGLEYFKLVILPLLCIGLIAKENLSTGIVCGVIFIGILLVAAPKKSYVFVTLILIAFAAAFLIFCVGYRQDRIDAWLHVDTSEDGFQTRQSLYAIGSGGLFGRGLGNSIQKLGFLPESHNDMIFSVICEELGLFGAICIIALFLILVFRLKYISDNTRDRFGGLVIVGILIHVAAQFFVNVGVCTNLLPNTGVTLPFISYGGTSLVFMLCEMGIALNISRHMRPLE